MRSRASSTDLTCSSPAWSSPSSGGPSRGFSARPRSPPGAESPASARRAGPALRDPQHAQDRGLQGFAQFLVGQVGQLGQALRDEEEGAEGEQLGGGGGM